jgi:transcriptional regulator with XRE-family HTH domain
VQSVDLTVLGQRVRERRKSLGWSQEELASHANVDRSYVGGVERGERNVTFTMLCQLCAALGCKVGDLASDLPEGPQ